MCSQARLGELRAKWRSPSPAALFALRTNSTGARHHLRRLVPLPFLPHQRELRQYSAQAFFAALAARKGTQTTTEKGPAAPSI